MFLFGKNIDHEVAVIAEIGVNHEGSYEAAVKMLHLAHEAGADAAKFQTYTAEKFIASNDPARLSRVKNFALNFEQFIALKQEGEKIGIPVFSAAISDDVVPFLAEHFPVIKIASGDLNFKPVIQSAIQTGKPVILSTGLGTVEEIENAVRWAKDALGEEADLLKERLILMHCVTSYPAPIEQANVLSVPFLAEKFGLRVGYSNHVVGLAANYAAVALGCCLLEVHFTDCKTGREFRDHEISCDPEDLKKLVEMTKQIRQSLGVRGKMRMECELPMLQAVRKGLVAARNIMPGEKLEAKDIMYARPASEFSADEIDIVCGKTVLQPLMKGHTIPRTAVVGS